LKKKEINSVRCKETIIIKYVLNGRKLLTGNDRSFVKESVDEAVQHGLITDYKLGRI
jgi:hypothetical protein